MTPRRGHGAAATSGSSHRRLGVEDLTDAVGGRGGARDHREHERGHHHRHQDLHDVGEERRQVADRHRAARDALAAEPQHGHRRQVQDPEQARDHHGEDAVDLQRGVGEVRVRHVEALLLEVVAHERADDTHARERLAHDLVDAVDLDLHRAEQRHRLRERDADERRHERQDDDEQCPRAARPGEAP